MGARRLQAAARGSVVANDAAFFGVRAGCLAAVEPTVARRRGRYGVAPGLLGVESAGARTGNLAARLAVSRLPECRIAVTRALRSPRGGTVERRRRVGPKARKADSPDRDRL